MADKDLNDLIKEMDFKSPILKDRVDDTSTGSLNGSDIVQSTTTDRRVLLASPSITKSTRFENIYGETTIKPESVLTNLPQSRFDPPSPGTSVNIQNDNSKK